MRARFSGYLVWGDMKKSLEEWIPDDPEDFELQLDFHAGPEGKNTADAFAVRVCSPNWFFRKFGDTIVSGQHTIFMRCFDGAELISFLKKRCAEAEGETWTALAVQLGRVGRWEFDYKIKAQ